MLWLIGELRAEEDSVVVLVWRRAVCWVWLRWNMVLLWICDQNSVDDTPVFWLLLNSACAASRPPPFLTLPTGWTGGWEGTQLTQTD